MKIKVLVFSLFFIASVTFAQTTNLPEWVNRVPEFANLTSSQLRSKFPAANVEVSEQGVRVGQFPTEASNSAFMLNSRGNVSRWFIVFPAVSVELNRIVYEMLVSQFTATYGEPRSNGTQRMWTNGLPEKALGLTVDIEQRGVTVQWMYGF